VRVELGAEDVARAAGVRQEVVKRDLGRDLPVGVVGQELAERIVQPDRSGLHELQDRRRGEHLVHRADAEARVDAVRDLPLAVRQTVRRTEHRLALVQDEHRTGEPVGAYVVVQLRPERGSERVVGQRRDGEVVGAGDGLDVQPGDEVRFRCIDFHGHPGKLIGQALLDEGVEVLRCRALDLAEIEPAAHVAEAEQLLRGDLRRVGRKTLREELAEARAVRGVECIEPRSTLTLRRRHARARSRQDDGRRADDEHEPQRQGEAPPLPASEHSGIGNARR
jgi:hypothetical protein